MKKGLCKLCLQNKELCRESHIIPQFMYKFIAGDNNLIVFLDSKKSRFKYNGEYEGGILCQDCDTGIIGKLESYAADLLYGKLPGTRAPKTELIDGQECIVMGHEQNYDYRRFKLFLLSVLWRASISTRPFFKQAHLPSDVEERIRLMILEDDPGEPDEYACFICLPPLEDGSNGKGFYTSDMPIMSPVRVATNGMDICRFVIQGTHYFFVISKPPAAVVKPSVDKNRLILGISTREEQGKLHRDMIEMMKNHPRGTSTGT